MDRGRSLVRSAPLGKEPPEFETADE